MRIFSILFFFVSINLYAVNYSSNANGSWTNTAIWTPSGIPGAGDNVTIGHNVTLTLTSDLTIASLTGSANRTLTISTDGSARNFSVTGGVDLKQDLIIVTNSNVTMNIGGNLSFSGTGGTLTQNSGSVINVSGSFNSNGSTAITLNTGSTMSVAGNMSLAGSGSNFVVATGATLSIAGTMTITGGTNVIDLAGTVNVNDLVASGGSQDLDIMAGGRFNIANDASFSGSATFDVQNAGIMDVNGDMSIVGGSNGIVNGNLSVDGTLSFASGTNKITGSGVISASNVVCPGYLAPCTSMFTGTLPIRLVYFKVESGIDGNICKWQTASEENNHFFTIERSTDGQNFIPVTNIDGAGNSSQLLDYLFTDTYKGFGVIYYRLKQTDYDGQFAYSCIVKVHMSGQSVLNAANNELTLTFSNISGEYDITVYNIMGQLVTSCSSIFESEMPFKVRFEAPKGVYILNVAQKGNILLSKHFIY